MANELITAREIIKETGITSNFEHSRITPRIEEIQKRHLLPLLSKDLYDEIIGEIGSFSAANSTLVTTYIKPYLAYIILWEILPDVHYKISNAGIVVNEGELERSAGRGEFDLVRKLYRERADNLLEFMKTFLDDNTGTYPLWEIEEKRNVKNGIIFY